MKRPVAALVLLVLSFIGIKAYSNANLNEHISANTTRIKATSGYILTGNAGVPGANVSVKNAAGATALKGFAFIAAPSVTAFSPSSAGAGRIVTISGVNFTGATAVTFGGTPAASFTVVSPISIIAVVGAGESGNVQVITPDGTATMPGFSFVPAPTITEFTPTSAGVPDVITIIGTNFFSVTDVSIGGVRPSIIRVVSSKEIQVTVNFTTSGSVVVKTTGGIATLAGFIFITKPPTITSFSPAAAALNDQVSITGTNFTRATHVYFGGVETSFTLISPTLIVANLTSVNSGRIMVTTPGGTATSATDLIYFPEPKITSFGPATAAKGDTVTITGSNFTGASAINFGGDPAASFTVVSSTSIAAVVGAGASGNIQITTPGGTDSVPNFTFLPAPTISTFTPDFAGAFEPITITGSNFVGIKAVSIGGAPAYPYNVVSPTTIIAYVEFGATSGSVEVTTTGGKATLAGFTFLPKPTISSFKPTTAVKGDTVTITGENLTGTTSVRFGGVPAASYTVTSPTSISAILGLGASGNITITTPGRTATSGKGLTFLQPPTITSFSPAVAAGNIWITITGTNFTNVTHVSFGGVEPTFVVEAPYLIRVTSVLGLNSGKIMVTTPAGTATSATDFTYVPGPKITSFCPATVTEGDTVTVTGTNFTDVKSVTFGSVPASSFTVTSPTSILAKVGPGATGQVIVNTAYGTGVSPTDLTFLSGVAITSFSPAGAKQGDTVTITGTNFEKYNVRYVTFGGVSATSFKVTSPTTILATVGAGAGGKVMIFSAGNEVYSATDLIFFPEIISFSPAKVAQGDTVTITGTKFTGATNVMFGGWPAASFTVTSPTTILATVGSGANGKITVTTPYGTASSAARLTFIPPPVLYPDLNLPGSRYSHIPIFGHHLSGATHAYINGVEINIISVTAELIIVGGNIANSGPITITTPGGTGSAGYFTFIPEPTIASFSPATVASGDIVTITGTDFIHVSEVKFGGVPAASFAVTSPTSISAKIGPLGATGKVILTATGGAATSATNLTFLSGASIASFSPATAAFGDIVTITGTNFTGATKVTFGGVPAASFTVTSPTSISATVGAGAGGKVMVLVGGDEVYSAADLTFLPTEITSVSRTQVAYRDTVIITGAQFTGATKVMFGNTPAASFTVTSPTSILATVGSGASGKITVIAPGGTALSATRLTYIPAPYIDVILQTKGGLNTRIGIVGLNFTGATHAYIGGIEVPITELKPKIMQVRVTSATSGSITVTTPGGTAGGGFNNYFTYIEQPAITSFTPVKAAQGETVTISGIDLTGATSVTFGGVLATSFTVTSPTSISARVGPGASGKIIVTTPESTATSENAFTFLPPPVITSFSPATAAKGGIIKITGTNFADVTAVSIGGVAPISYTRLSPTSIAAKVGPGASGKISVISRGGTATSATEFIFLSPPAVTFFTPAKAAQGDTVIITGSNFTGATNVTFGGVEAPFSVVSPTTISARVSSGANGKVTVTNPDGTATSTAAFTFLPPPAITSFTPAAAGPGATVTITGSNFKKVTSVSIGGVPSASFSVLSATTISAIVFAHATSGNVEVTTTCGKATLSGFTFLPKPVITSYSPTRAVTGDVITITGSNFSDVTAVRFNVVPARSFTVVSSTSIIATVGEGASGNVNVMTTGGASSKPGFFYIQAPTITSFSPATAAQGDIITITGTNLADVTAVSIGGIAPAAYTRSSPTSILARLGPGASGKITVTSRGGTATSATDLNFLSPPAITSFTPARTGQGQIVTITGANFTGATAVRFGNLAPRSFTVVSPTTITAILGAGASGNVTVVTAGGTSTRSGFVYIQPPTITSFSPPEAPAGWDIFIFGTNLSDVTSVKFGGVAGPFTIQSDNTILAKDISGTSGKITVTSPAGTATSATNFISGKASGYVLITSFTPATAAQGDTVAINGINFNTAPLHGINFGEITNVTFGGVPAASFIVRSPTSILATVGAGASGNISLTTPERTVTSADAFIFLPTTAKMSFNLAATGMKEQPTNILKGIIAYPDPFINSLALNLGDKVFKKLRVDVLSYFGKVLYSKEFVDQSGVITLDLSGLGANQIYVLKLSADNTQYITKIAKK